MSIFLCWLTLSITTSPLNPKFSSTVSGEQLELVKKGGVTALSETQMHHMCLTFSYFSVENWWLEEREKMHLNLRKTLWLAACIATTCKYAASGPRRHWNPTLISLRCDQSLAKPKSYTSGHGILPPVKVRNEPRAL